MYVKTLEQQLKNRGWISNFTDQKLAKKLFEQTAEALGDEEKVYSVSWANKIDHTGQPSVSLWLLVLTKKELFFVELDTDEDTWRSTPQRIEIKEIQMVEKGTSHLNPDLLRVNIISREKGFVFQSIDSDSAFHFVDQANRLIKGEEEKMNDETLNLTKSRDFQDLEAIPTTKAKTVATNRAIKKPHKNKKKNQEIFNYFFNFSSLFKSKPALEVLFLFFQFIWILCDMIYIGLVDAMKLNDDGRISLGVIMLIFNLLGFLTLIPYLINIWKPETITNKARTLILIEVMMLVLLGVSISMLANQLSQFTFAIVGLMFGVVIFSWIGIEFSRKLIEWQATKPNQIQPEKK